MVSLKAARDLHTQEVQELLEPVVKKVNDGIREAFTTWQREGAPLLEQLHEIDPL